MSDPAAQTSRIRADVHQLATEIGERNVYQYPKLCEAANFIEQALLAAGHKPHRQRYEARNRVFYNIDAEIPGEHFPEEIVVVGAHYDTARGSPGANDNGSGVAATLELARLLAGERLSRTLRFVAFTNEERPFLRTPQMGSRVYARRCRERNEKITAMISLETIGYCSSEPGSQWLSFFGSLYPSRGDYIVLVANPSSKQLLHRTRDAFRRSAHVPCETAVLPSFSPGAKSSDHWSFWKEGYCGMMVTDTAPLRYPHYHRPSDTPDKLRYDFLTGVIDGLVGTIRELAKTPKSFG
jgi:Zn-dependent M28 family amino/carboxypeptidase